MVDEWLSPGAFAERSRLSPKALRLYASNRILVPAEIDPMSGYRRYHVDQLQDARTVRLMRQSDMPLTLVAELLAAPRAERAALVAEYGENIRREYERRLALVHHLAHSLSGGKDEYPMHEIKTRHVTDQVVLTEQAHVTATQLSGWIASTGMAQLKLAATIGGQIGPSMVIYHGVVSEDSDGPVESCIPVDPGSGDLPSLPIRVEPAHREVYTTVTRAQIRYPDLLSAYDALEQWLTENGSTAAGPPREIYFADPSSGPDDDVVADVAIPI